MSRIHSGQQLIPSLLDRLLDDAPDSLQELPSSRTQRLRDLKLSVRRDLENLLNTRVCLRVIPNDCEELHTSVFNYGIPDFGGMAVTSSEKQEILRRRIEEIVRRFETRFKSVRVELVTDDKLSMQRSIRFRIDGVLYAEPAPEPVSFDSQVVPTIGVFQVKASDI
jgi:type VI secretion system protein ImpF